MQLTSLIGTKTYQKQGFLQNGKRVPLTGVSVVGNVITQVKTIEKEGYNSIQLGVNQNKKARKSLKMHANKAGLEETPRFFKEIRMDDLEGATAGTKINAAEIFAPGDMVDVTGISKGKGWAGGVKRYGFKGGPKTHGQSDRHRAPGSIGQTTTPGRVYKGKKMAGRMGSDTVTVKNLEVIEVTEDGVLLIKGLVPGNVNGLVMINKIGTNKKFVPLYKEVIEEPQKMEVSEEAQPEQVSSQAVPVEQAQAPVEPVEEVPVTLESEDSKEKEIKEEVKEDAK